MTFEPLIYTSEWPFTWKLLGAIVLGAFVAAAIVFFVTLGYLHLKKSEQLDKAGEAGFMAFLLGGMVACFWMYETQFAENKMTVKENLIQKYAIEEVIFAPRDRGMPDYLPEQTGPQPVTIKANGESRLAILIQDRASSEPTLLNVDTNEPLEDILKK
jgi:hypothetical protein